ncbi:two-component sensor histidine kinase [Vibrio sp. MACH09]|uniref:sensor histidine kinase n=1 Tax=Vibrio sp. MACH09 TaxID=3025122 RepID=UPI00278E1430|nr:HAMP domain-containing sensor histidine kinase [Vibrio sp. MACH09]GLO62456.1 two-component sensor histidine kinase [Vibrio sp. MACH09]
MIALKKVFKAYRGSSIKDVKARLLITFSFIALTTSFIVFFAFSIRLVVFEDSQIESHLTSFQDIAVDYYQLNPVKKASLSAHVTAYYGAEALPEKFMNHYPYALDEVSRFRSYNSDGYMVFHREFNFGDKTVPMYLTIDSRAIEFGDDSWADLMGVSMLLMVFLILVLRFSLRRVFDGLMSPVSELNGQLVRSQDAEFSVSDRAIDELKQLTSHLNQYRQMKERVAKQELMFAKYASHELKTPIAVVLGAANLQPMKQDKDFQEKQRQRILTAATGMHETVEVLLNIVKQENASSRQGLFPVTHQSFDLSSYQNKLAENVELQLTVEENTQINLPDSVLRMVINNLVENAIRFTKTGRINIFISSTRIQVVDTGTGLTDKPETEHGLGLLIVERICQSYGWVCKLENNAEAKGCIVTMDKREL